jgi:formamidopyrimidine-DNA glycosylase
MPELPDIAAYLSALAPRVLEQPLDAIRIRSPFLVRSVEPPITEAQGRRVTGLRRVGKRIVLALEGELFLVLHLMISGRLQWKPAGAKIPGKLGLAAFDFPTGTLLLTEASTKKRASIQLLRGESALRAIDPGGIDVLASDLATFRERLTRENHTLKRALTDPRFFSGIGNAYSDEILHRARLSPVRLTAQMKEEEIARLHDAAHAILSEWTERLTAEAAAAWPVKVTAFREGMAVHGRYREPCPVCGSPVQRIVHAENETNYCARCQTGGRLLADRALSRILKSDWPRSLEELEENLAARRDAVDARRDGADRPQGQPG